MLVILLVVLSLYTVNALQCGYTDTEGYLYDFSELQNPNNYKVIENNHIYLINVCNTVTEPQCRQHNGIVCEYTLDSNNDQLLQLNAVLATSNGQPPQWNEDSDNIFQVYNNGESTYNSQYSTAPTVTFKYECNDKPSSGTSAGIKPIMLPSTTANEYTFEFQVQQACAEYLDRTAAESTADAPPVPDRGPKPHGGPRSRHSGMHTSTLLFMLICIFVSVYFILGILYNRQSYGLSGIDALPHRDFWLELPGLVADGAKYCTDKTSDLYHRLRGHSTTRTHQSATYEQI